MKLLLDHPGGDNPAQAIMTVKNAEIMIALRRHTGWSCMSRVMQCDFGVILLYGQISGVDEI